MLSTFYFIRIVLARGSLSIFSVIVAIFIIISFQVLLHLNMVALRVSFFRMVFYDLFQFSIIGPFTVFKSDLVDTRRLKSLQRSSYQY